MRLRERSSRRSKRGSGRSSSSARPAWGASREEPLTAQRVLALQETAGNRAVADLLTPRPGPEAEEQADVVGARLAADLDGLPTPAAGALPDDVRSVAEHHLGVGLEGTRVSVSDAQRDDVGDALGWARGSEVGFRPGRLAGTASGHRLLGHELTHVAQQRAGSPTRTQHKDPDDQLTSRRMSENAELQKAFRNRPPIKRGASGEHVMRIQETLLDAGFLLPKSGVAYTELGGGTLLDGKFGPETFKALQDFQRDKGLTPDGIVGHNTMKALDGVAGTRTPSGQPVGPALEEDQDTRKYSPQEYIEMWERHHGRRMTPREKRLLAHGCIGITALNLGQGGTPPLGLSFSSFAKAKQVRDALNKIIAAQPAMDQLPDEVVAHPDLAGLKNVLQAFPVGTDPSNWSAVIFSKRFYSNQAEKWEDRVDADDDAFQPDKDTGQVDMTGYQYRGRPDTREGRTGAEFTNFDYGWYDEDTDSWWHANHADPGMEVYQSTLEHYSRPLLDFDRQVFSVAIAVKP